MNLVNLIKDGIRLNEKQLDGLGYKSLNARFSDYDIYGKDTERLLLHKHADGSIQLCYRYYTNRDVFGNLEADVTRNYICR